MKFLEQCLALGESAERLYKRAIPLFLVCKKILLRGSSVKERPFVTDECFPISPVLESTFQRAIMAPALLRALVVSCGCL